MLALADPAFGVGVESRFQEPGDDSLDGPLPESGNLIGFLQVLHKADLELLSDDETALSSRREGFGRIRTKAAARAYVKKVRTEIDAAQPES